MKHLFLILAICMAVVFAKAQVLPDTIVFGNGIGCNQDVDIDWEFFDTGGPCSPGSTNVLAGGTFTILASACTSLPLMDFRITLNAINGCLLSPPLTLWWSNIASPGGQTDTHYSCPCPPTPPPGQTCCDNGNWFVLRDTGGTKAQSYAN